MSKQGYRRYLCRVCGFIYDEAKGDPDGGLPPGTRFEDIPEDWMCPLCGVGKADMVLMAERPSTAGARTVPVVGRGRRGMQSEPVVVVGGGIAGWTAVERIRSYLPEQPITLVSACDASVYHKPALSIAIAKGKAPDDLVEQTAEARAATLGLTLRTGTRALRIDTARQRLVTTRGTLRYKALVLAVGATQKRVPVPTASGAETLTVNDLDSYRRLRRRVDGASRRVAIIGAGLIGCELAEDLAAGGHAVTLIDQAPQPLSALLPRPVGVLLAESQNTHGITYLGGSNVEGIDAGANGQLVKLAGGQTVAADVVLSAIGLQPVTAMAAKAAIATGRGVLANGEDMSTSAPGVYAVGDCAEVNGRVYSYIEPIQRQAEAVAAALAGDSRPFVSAPPLVRIKTPSLPLVVCPPSGRTGRWRTVSADGRDWHLEYRSGATLLGFALSGTCTQLASALYEEVKAAEPVDAAALAAPALSAIG